MQHVKAPGGGARVASTTLIRSSITAIGSSIQRGTP